MVVLKRAVRRSLPLGGTLKSCELWQSSQVAIGREGSSLSGLAWKEFL